MATTGFIRVKNLTKYQHYSDRNPPWVKLHTLILESYEFGHLPDASKWHALGILLLASKLDNQIPADPAWIATRICANTRVNIDVLVNCGFLERIASTSLADCQQNGGTETEGETEREDIEHADFKSVDAGKNGDQDPDRWSHVLAALDSTTWLRDKPRLRDLRWWDALAKAYPHDDLDPVTEIAKMDAWISEKRPKYRDWQRFVRNWLQTAEERLA